MLITRVYQVMGGAPKPLVKWAFQLSSFQKLVTKPLAVATHLDDADFLAQIEAVDRFTAEHDRLPGPHASGSSTTGSCAATRSATGRFELGDRTIELAAITAPVLVFAGATDGIAPVDAVKAVVPLLTGSAEVRFEIVPGGHLGMLTGRAARGTTWRVLDEWVGQWSTPDAGDEGRAAGRRRGARRPPRRRRREEGARQEAAEPRHEGRQPEEATAAETRSPIPRPSTPSSDAIGVNPTRRYGSARLAQPGPLARGACAATARHPAVHR